MLDTGKVITRYIDRTVRPGTEAAGDRARHRTQPLATAVIALKVQAMLGLTIMINDANDHDMTIHAEAGEYTVRYKCVERVSERENGTVVYVGPDNRQRATATVR